MPCELRTHTAPIGAVWDTFYFLSCVLYLEHVGQFYACQLTSTTQHQKDPILVFTRNDRNADYSHPRSDQTGG